MMNTKSINEQPYNPEPGSGEGADLNLPGGKNKRRRRSWFYLVLLIIIVLLLGAIGAGTYYFWGYIESYENSRLENMLNSLQENIDYDFWQKCAEDALALRLSEFEDDAAAALRPYLARIRDVKYILRQNNALSTPEVPVYTMRAGARDIGTVRFSATESVGHGFFRWDVESIEFMDSFIDDMGADISLTVSQNAEVRFNGRVVSDSYLVECEYEYGATYKIEGIYSEFDVEVVELDGRISEPYQVDGRHIMYPITIPFSRSFDITVPEGVPIYVNGAPVADARITDVSVMPAILVGIIEPADFPLKLYRYEFELDGLYLEPEVTVDTYGKDLIYQVTSDGGQVYSYKEEYSAMYKNLYSDYVGEFIRAYVNFSTNIGHNIQEHLAVLNEYIVKYSEFYHRIQGTVDTLHWVAGTTVKYNKLEIDNFKPYGDNYFTCEVSYDITNTTYYETRELVGAFEILFTLKGEQWLVQTMEAIS